jgi:hypothetical protein
LFLQLQFSPQILYDVTTICVKRRDKAKDVHGTQEVFMQKTPTSNGAAAGCSGILLLDTPEKMAALLREANHLHTVEHFLIALLNARPRLIEIRSICQGPWNTL